jgi:PAS domain S-box-containing protein
MPGRKRVASPKKPPLAKAFNAKSKKTVRKKKDVSILQALRESQDKLNLALSAAQMGIWEWDIETNDVTWSDNVLSIFGQNKNSFDGTFDAYSKLIYPDDVEMVIGTIREAVSVRKNYFIQHRIVWLDGSIRWVEAAGKVIVDKQGEPVKMTGTVQDITEFKLKTAENDDWKIRYELITASSGQVVYDYHIPSGKIVWSGNIYEVLGCNAGEMGDIVTWGDLIHPDDREKAFYELERAEKLLTKYDVTYRFRKKDGDYVFMHDRGFFLPGRHGKAERMLGTMQDISDKIRAEEIYAQNIRFRESIEKTMPGELFVHDLVQRRNLYSTGKIISGYTHEEVERMAPDFPMALVHPDDIASIAGWTDEPLGTIKESLFRLRKKDGGWLWISSRTTVFKKDENGNVVQIIGIAQDVTERKAVEEQIRERDKSYRELFDTVNEAIYIQAPDGTFVDVNETSCKMYGYDKKDFIGNTPAFLSAPGKNDFDALMKQTELALQGHPQSFEWWGQRKDGSIFLKHVQLTQGSYLGNKIIIATARDITEERSAIDQLHKSEQSYRELFNTVGQEIYILTLQGTFLDVNTGACEMYGYHKEEFIGRTPEFLAVEGKNNLTQLSDILQKAAAGTPQSMDWWGKRKDGGIFLREVRIYRGTYFGQEVLVAIAWDITDRKNKEDILRESEKRFRNLIRNLNIGVLLQDDQANIVLSNKTAQELLDLSEDALLGRSLFNPGWRVIHEDGSDFPGAAHPVPQVMRTYRPVRGTVMGVCRDTKQDIVWLLVNAEPILNEQKKIIEVICTFTDITTLKNIQQELRESEQRFRILQEASFGGIGLHDRGVVIDCNQGLCDITGYPYEELIGRNGLDLIAPEWQPMVMNNIRSGYEKPYDVEGIRKDGTRYFLEVHAKNIPYHGKTIRVTEFRDITDRKLSEEKIIEQNIKLQAITEDLKRKNEQLEEFTQIVSHNLRSPVGNILTLLSFFEGTEAEDEKAEYLKLLKESGVITLNTLHELNEVLKIKQNKNIEKQQLVFNTVFLHVKAMVSARITETGAEIYADFSAAPMIEYPRIYLESVLLNLLSNALKYIYPGRPPVIYFKTYTESGNTFLQVTDNGLGINLERYGHQIFKLRKTFHRHPESRGIGLFMIKNQIEAMGGDITISSRENEGTTFNINFNKYLTDGK